MSLNTKRLLFFIVWFLIVISGPVAIFDITPVASVTRSSISLINFFQRISGVLLFSLLFIQIVLGSQMDKLNQILGAKAYRFHITQGLFILFLVFFHPLMGLAIIYQISGSIVDSLAMFLPSFSTEREVYLTCGRVTLVILLMTIGAGYFRTKKIFRKYWHTIHLLNYVVFYLVFLHMRVGTDLMSPPFVWVTWLALVLVTVTLLLRLKSAFWPRLR